MTVAESNIHARAGVLEGWYCGLVNSSHSFS
jgi:hypothetical protein